MGKQILVVLGKALSGLERTRVTIAADLRNVTDQSRLPAEKVATGIKSAQTQFLR